MSTLLLSSRERVAGGRRADGGWNRGSLLNTLGGKLPPIILNFTYIILLQALWTRLVFFMLLNFLSQNYRTGAHGGDVSEGNRPLIGPRWR